MIYETHKLLPFEDATLTALCVTNTEELNQTPRRAVILCPGGGYRFLCDRDAEPVLVQFLAAGFATFMLKYSVKEGAKDYAPLKQAALAVKHVRENAARYNVDPDYVFISGLSAGGHLAASTGVLWDSPALKDVLGDAPEGIARPTGMVLTYPVITASAPTHRGSFRYLCGKEDFTEEEASVFSLEQHVNETTPPAFMWHSFADQLVPVRNTLVFAEAMLAAGVPFEMHIFPEGPHGQCLCTEQSAGQNPKYLSPHNACWVDLAIQWIRDFKL